MLGGLSNTVGYRFENEAFKALPRLLEEQYGIHDLLNPMQKIMQGKKTLPSFIHMIFNAYCIFSFLKSNLLQALNIFLAILYLFLGQEHMHS